MPKHENSTQRVSSNSTEIGGACVVGCVVGAVCIDGWQGVVLGAGVWGLVAYFLTKLPDNSNA